MSGNSFTAGLKMLGPIVWLALGAGSQMGGALLLFHLSPTAVLIGTYATISFSIYLLNRFTDLEDAYNCPDQGFFFHRRTALVVIPIMLMIGSLALAWPHGWHCCSS
jgi:hypothetical protein